MLKKLRYLPNYASVLAILIGLLPARVVALNADTLVSNLPIVVINTLGQTIPDEPKITAKMGIIDNGPGKMNRLTDSLNGYNGWIGIEVRGQSSQMFPKKSYSVETRTETGENLDVPLMGLPADNDWVFYAPYSDKSLIRNHISLWMARKTDGYHSRTRFCEVVINGDYKGIYMLMEKIKKSDDRVDVSTLKPSDITGDDLTGGYIISVDKIPQGFKYNTDGWRSDVKPPYAKAYNIVFQYYYPDADEIVSPQRTYIRNYINTAEKVLIGAGFKDPDHGYQKYFDLPSFVDNLLICEISKDVDKYRYSTYFFKDKESNGGKLFAGPLWDFDLAYGNVNYWAFGVSVTGWLYPVDNAFDDDMMYWWRRLMEDPYFRDLTYTRWQLLRGEKLSDAAIDATIDSIVGVLHDPMERNFERWPILGTYVWPNNNWYNNDYNDEVNNFRTFLFNRIHWIDSNLPGKRLEPWAALAPEGNKIRLKLYGDYFRTNLPEPEDFILNDEPWGTTVLSVKYLSANECLLTLSSDITGHGEISVTVDKKVLNTYDDLTSGKLSATGAENLSRAPRIKVSYGHGTISVRCDQPQYLPESAEITDMAGRIAGRFPLGKEPLNTHELGLTPGVYIAIFRTGSEPVVCRFAVVND